jgi:acyl dehydratase
LPQATPASVTKTLTGGDIALFAAVSGNVNPIHLDERLAEASPLPRVVGHSLWGSGLMWGLLGTSGSAAPRWRPMASS